MRCYQYLPPLKFAYDDNKEAEEQRKEKEKEKTEERRMKRIFELVPRKKRSQLRDNKEAEEQRKEKEKEKKKKEEKIMKRIFELVPRKKRSQLRPTQHSPDLSNTKSKNITVYTNTTTPKWLLRLMKDMNTTTTEDDPILVTQKPLDLNDVDPIQNNLTIPFSSLLRNDFLTFQECQITENIHNDETMGVGAIIVDQRTKQWTVVLKKRVVKGNSWVSSRSYLLGGEWSDIVKANSLRDDDNISLWSFRRRGILFFALDFAGDAVDFFE